MELEFMEPMARRPTAARKRVSQEINPASRTSEGDYEAKAAPVVRPEHREGTITLLIEQQTAKIPSHMFLFLSLAAMAASLGFEIMNRERASRFVGMWAPSLLILGVYNKLVKTLGTQ